jgi:collagenase-like PrtC family protease
MTTAELTVGPVLFNWTPEAWRDFYLRIADEAPVDTVYVGEVVCAKREPFFAPHVDTVVARLQAGGKRVIRAGLAEVMLKHERRLTRALAQSDGLLVEANDASALYHLGGRPHAVGPTFNVYNEETLAELAARGAVRVTLPPELPGRALPPLVAAARRHGVTLEVQVYGRAPLALSARCYHARAHDRVKDNCRYVCAEDPDGLPLDTLDGQPFLTVNGIQVLSRPCLNLTAELAEMQATGIGAFRLSPHSGDMVAVARLVRAVQEGRMPAREATARLAEAGLDAPFANGFYHGVAGHRWVQPERAA